MALIWDPGGGRGRSSVPGVLLRTPINCLGDVREGRLWCAERESSVQCDKMEGRLKWCEGRK